MWGPSGPFPWLSKYFDGLFDPALQLDYFLSWLSRFYRGCWNYDLENGQNIFLLGSVGVGKTLLSQGILPRLVGGSHDAEDYLLGLTNFNSQLFNVALWTVDDNSANVDAITHKKFSAMIKKMSARQLFESHQKFRTPCQVEWAGRVVITANDDEESARIVPDLSINILDKMMLFRSARKAPVTFPARKELIALLERELPHFARFLLDFEYPDHCKGSTRFGVRAYHEPSLLETAEQSSQTAVFYEVIHDWAESHFAETINEFWEGTSLQFLKALHGHDLSASSALRTLTAQMVSKGFMGLKAKGFPIESHSVGSLRFWRINRKLLQSTRQRPSRVVRFQSIPSARAKASSTNGQDSESQLIETSPEPEPKEPIEASSVGAADTKE